MTGIVDAWMQHPTLRLANHEMLDSLRRWVGVEAFEDAIPLVATIEAMDVLAYTVASNFMRFTGIGRFQRSAYCSKPEA